MCICLYVHVYRAKLLLYRVSESPFYIGASLSSLWRIDMHTYTDTERVSRLFLPDLIKDFLPSPLFKSNKPLDYAAAVDTYMNKYNTYNM